ncbi:MAG: SusC/RagA family TonB-linked outer membrane protein [Marinifilaceae bacterium]|jgi:TonB-linked SusC/RagA family outer membrane protein|nr:SusC/RagA family TonB-linked outer membrane protein [Marinifilaceae bacterium]
MILRLLFTSFIVLSSFSCLFGQSEKLNIKKFKSPIRIEEFVNYIQRHTRYEFVYSSVSVSDKKITVPQSNRIRLDSLLKQVLLPVDLDYIVYRRKIIIKKRDNSVPMVAISSLAKIISSSNDRSNEDIILVGRIFDDLTGAVLIGANVAVKRTGQGSISDADGVYTLNCLYSDTVSVSCIGYNSYQFVAGKRTVENIRLKPKVVNLNEINIIGYGQELEIDRMGAISKIPPSMGGFIPNSIDDCLSGTASGMWVQNSSGLAGSASSISVRGVTSLQPFINSPLIVVDGVPLFSANEQLNNVVYRTLDSKYIDINANYVVDDIRESTVFYKNGLNLFNPVDIESIHLLKDAFSTSIFGSRGAAGVLMINTKKPKSREFKMNISSEFGVLKPVDEYQTMNAKEYAKFYSEYYSFKTGDKIFFPENHQTNWYDLVTRSGFLHNFNLSADKYFDRWGFYSSVSRNYEQSYIKSGDYDRYNGQFNFNYNPSSRLKLVANFSLSGVKNTALLAPKIYRDAVLKAPNIPVYDNDRNYVFDNYDNPFGGFYTNPMSLVSDSKAELKDLSFLFTGLFEYNITKNIKYQFNYGFNSLDIDACSKYLFPVDPETLIGVDSEGKSRRRSYSHMLTYDKKNNDHNLSTVTGFSYESTYMQNEFLEYSIDNNTNKRKDRDLETESHKSKLVSYFGRVKYGFKHRYFIGLSGRLDGSSNSSLKNAYHFFPAFSTAFVPINNSSYKFLNFLKFRFSCGLSGVEQTTDISNKPEDYHLSSYQYIGKEAYVNLNSELRNLNWEITKSYDIGFDLKSYRYNIDLSFNIYRKYVDNLLIYADVPLVFGYTKKWQNIGKMMNRGFELSLSGKLFKSSELNINYALKAAYNLNIVKEINYFGYEAWGHDQAYKYFKEGEEAAQFYLYNYQGVDSQTGNSLWLNSKGEIVDTRPTDSNDDRYPFGTGLPKYSGGINLSFNYKNLSLNIYTVYAYKRYMMNGSMSLLSTYTSPEAYNLSPKVANYWKQPGDITDEPGFANKSVTKNFNYINSRTSSRFLEDASFLRFKNIILEYSLTNDLCERLSLKSFSLYIRFKNMFTITKYIGADPEVSAYGSSSLLSGNDELTMPQSKSISIGVKISL